jgi:uncharacterized protein (TIGR02246 family)
MLNHVRIATLVGAAALLSACGTGSAEQAAGAPADRTAINELRSKYQAAYNAGNAAAATAVYTDDAVSLPDHHDALQGKVAIQKYLQDTFGQYNATINLAPGDTEISGSLAHEHGTYSIKVTPKAGGETVVDDGKYIVILKRGADGTWKIHHDMDNSNRMPPMPGQGERH